MREQIVSFLSENLGLSLSKSTIATIRRGINFVGYRTWQGKRFVRKHSLFKFKRKAAVGDQAAVASMLGHAKRTSSLIHLFKLIKENGHDLEIPKGYRRLYNLHAC